MTSIVCIIIKLRRNSQTIPPTHQKGQGHEDTRQSELLANILLMFLFRKFSFTTHRLHLRPRKINGSGLLLLLLLSGKLIINFPFCRWESADCAKESEKSFIAAALPSFLGLFYSPDHQHSSSLPARPRALSVHIVWPNIITIAYINFYWPSPG